MSINMKVEQGIWKQCLFAGMDHVTFPWRLDNKQQTAVTTACSIVLVTIQTQVDSWDARHHLAMWHCHLLTASQTLPWATQTHILTGMTSLVTHIVYLLSIYNTHYSWHHSDTITSFSAETICYLVWCLNMHACKHVYRELLETSFLKQKPLWK